VAAFAVVVIFHGLDISAWFDEAFSFGMAAQPAGSFLSHWAWGAESNMFLYYLVLRAWLGGLGALHVAPVEVLLRLPSALFAVGAAVGVFAIGRRLFGRVAGLVASGLYTTNFMQMILAQNARAYSLELLLLSLSWLALIVALEDNRRRWWVAYACTTALSVYAHLFSVLVIASQVAALGAMLALPGPWRLRVRTAFRPIVLSLLVSGIVAAPIVFDAVIHGGPVWVPPAKLGDLRLFLHSLAGNGRRYEYAVFAAAALGMVLAAAAMWRPLNRINRAQRPHLAAAAAMACWFAVPIALSFVLTQSWLNLHLFYPRYLVVVVPPLSLLVGLAVGSLRPRLAQAGAAAVLLAVALPSLGLYYQLAQVQDFKTPVLWMQSRYQAGDGLICDPAVTCSIPVQYYLAAYPGPAQLEGDSPGYFSWESNSSLPLTQAAIASYAKRHHRIFVIYAPLSRGGAGDVGATQVEDSLTALGYSPVDQVRTHAVASDTSIVLFATP